MDNPWWSAINRETAGMETWIDGIINDVLHPKKVPAYMLSQQKVIYPYDIALTTANKNMASLSRPLGSVYYMVVAVKTMGNANIINIGFPQSTSTIQLTNYNSYYEWSAPANSYIDLTGLYGYTDQGTATVTISGVMY